MLARVIGRSAELPDDPSVYDVTQVFTSVANEGVTYRTQLRLQRIGGDLIAGTEHMLHCGERQPSVRRGRAGDDWPSALQAAVTTVDPLAVISREEPWPQPIPAG